MDMIELNRIAIKERLPYGETVIGYCTVDGCVSVMCTRDKRYIEIGGCVDDCSRAKETTKAKCSEWHKVKPFKVKREPDNG